MKKAVFIFPVLFFVIVSCKKDYTCECIIGDDVVHSTTTIKDTKDKATDKCNENDDTVNSIECSIK